MNRDQPEDILAEVRQCVEHRQYAAALDLVNAIRETKDTATKWPIVAELLLLGGVSQYELGKLDDAESMWLEGLRLVNQPERNGNPAPFLHELAMLRLKQGNLEESESFVRQAIAIQMKQTVIIARTGFVKYHHHDLAPLVPQLSHLAVVYQHRGEYDQAKAILRYARVIAERSYHRGNLGVVLNELGLATILCGEHALGTRWLVESIRIKLTRNDRIGISKTVANVATLMQSIPEFTDRWQVAVQLLRLKDMLG